MNARQDEMAITREAAEWFTTLEEGNTRDRAAFSEWLLRSPLHVQEFLNQTAVHRLFEKVDAQRNIDVGALLREGHNNIVELKSASAHPVQTKLSRRRMIAAAAAVALVAIPLATWLFMQSGWENYTTAVGEQRAVELEDGSLIHLSADSRARVRLGSGERRIRLLRGEALFTVRQDRARPFRVQAGEAVIEALGTEFDVNRRTRDTSVAVVEGTVGISTGDTPMTRLGLGEQANISSDGRIGARGTIDPAQIASWRQRRLAFRADTLEDIAAEFNRYNRSPRIRIEGAATGQRRFTGILDANQPTSLLHLLAETDDLTSERHGEELIVRAR